MREEAWSSHLRARVGTHYWGENFWETCTPVVSWVTAHLIIATSISCNLESSSIKFEQAHVHVDIKTDACKEKTYGFYTWEGMCVLKMYSNFHGLFGAGLSWIEWLKNGMETRGLIQSKLYPFIFIKKRLIVIVHVDDYLLFGTNKETIETLLQSIEKAKNDDGNYSFDDKVFELAEEGGAE